MTTRNNFDQSSTGINISFNGYFDTEKARYEFRENFKIIQHSSRNTNSILFYVDNGNLPDEDSIEFSVKGTKAAKIELLSKHVNFTKKEIRSWDKETLDSEIMDLVYGQRITLLNFEDLNSVLPSGLECVTNKPLVKISSRGYSQGDYSEVYYCPDDIVKAWGNLPVESVMKKTFDNLLWDCPVYAVLTINGEEYNYWDCPEADNYTFKREEFINWVAAQSPATKEALDDIIPQNLDYV